MACFWSIAWQCSAVDQCSTNNEGGNDKNKKKYMAFSSCFVFLFLVVLVLLTWKRQMAQNGVSDLQHWGGLSFQALAWKNTCFKGFGKLRSKGTEFCRFSPPPTDPTPFLSVLNSNLAHQNRTITVASHFHVDGVKSPIPQKEGVSGLEIAQIASNCPSHA